MSCQFFHCVEHDDHGIIYGHQNVADSKTVSYINLSLHRFVGLFSDFPHNIQIRNYGWTTVVGDFQQEITKTIEIQSIKISIKMNVNCLVRVKKSQLSLLFA